MVEGQHGGLETGHGRVVARGGGGEVDRVGHGTHCTVARNQVHGFDARELCEDLRQRGTAVQGLARVEHPVDRDQGLGLRLPPAIEHRIRPHVGRTQRPHRTQAGAGQQTDGRGWNIGQIGRHPIAWRNPACAQIEGKRGSPAT